MFTAIQSLNLNEFGLLSIRIGFHGKYNGRDRAFRLYKIWGANPGLRNSYLTGSYSSKQIKSDYGIIHLHI